MLLEISISTHIVDDLLEIRFKFGLSFKEKHYVFFLESQ